MENIKFLLYNSYRFRLPFPIMLIGTLFLYLQD